MQSDMGFQTHLKHVYNFSTAIINHQFEISSPMKVKIKCFMLVCNARIQASNLLNLVCYQLSYAASLWVGSMTSLSRHLGSSMKEKMILCVQFTWASSAKLSSQAMFLSTTGARFKRKVL
jgi:hypothetical protein